MRELIPTGAYDHDSDPVWGDMIMTDDRGLPMTMGIAYPTRGTNPSHSRSRSHSHSCSHSRSSRP